MYKEQLSASTQEGSTQLGAENWPTGRMHVDATETRIRRRVRRSVPFDVYKEQRQKAERVHAQRTTSIMIFDEGTVHSRLEQQNSKLSAC